MSWPGSFGRTGLRALALDVVLVLVFAAVGRRSHAEGVTVFGVAQTAWPFLAGLLVGWVVSLTRRGVPASVRSGVVVWAATVLVGMLLRWTTGAGTAPSFVVVATLVLGAFLLGWRLLATRLRTR